MAPEEVDFDFLNAPASEVAPRLLGCELEREFEGQMLRVKIVETEAYDQSDVASHSYKGKTARSEVMFGPAGHMYVYFTYGMHYCCNIVVGEEGYGAAVLIRAVEPEMGYDTISRNRGGRDGAEMTNGPAKLCQALAIDAYMNGRDLRTGTLRLIPKPPLDGSDIVQTTRVGISRGKDIPWRFYIRANNWVSKQ